MQELNPWNTLKSSEAYENKWIKVMHHIVVHPSGNEGVYGVVHFKHIAIGILVLDEEMNTWLVGQYRYPLNRYSWEIPEGGGDPQIDPLESAKRELLEETGLSAAEWQEIARMDLSNSATDEQAILFLARTLHYGEAQPEESEELRLRKIPFAELYEEVISGKITDSLTVAATLRVRLMLLEGKL